LKAGIGLYRALQTVAAADYGAASEELAQTIAEIEEGTDAKDALKHLALRTQSKPLRSALIHIVRAMKTGGNLSEIMNEIAEDVGFELRNKIRDFSERMNFYGVIYIFVAIVAPVAVGVIGAVVNARLGSSNALSSIPLDSTTIPIFYLLIMPLLLFYLVMLVVISQPKL